MVKVITYGTFDLLHYGHTSLLERARSLGDYLIVGITSDSYDKNRGKINNEQSLIERIAAVKETGLVDEIIVEEYEGQKIDDITRLGIDIFTVGSDWEGYFDYLNEYCKVVYLPRTEGISSSDVRAKQRSIKIGLVGTASFRNKFVNESAFVNGVDVVGICAPSKPKEEKLQNLFYTSDYDELLERVDAVYIVSMPERHYEDSKKALLAGKHVLCESPIAFSKNESQELFALANKKRLIMMDAIKTAYATAYERLVLMAKSGKIGQIVSVDAICTSLKDNLENEGNKCLDKWNSMCGWALGALLPVFQILGTDYKKKVITTLFTNELTNHDVYTKIDFTYSRAIASIKVAQGAKAEGELIITGTNGYIIVPAPWWKTDYFEIRYENQNENERYFFQLDGEGIRYEIVSFAKLIEIKKSVSKVSAEISNEISKTIYDFNNRIDFINLNTI